MKQVATALLFDGSGRLLICLRDDIPTIPFPGHWDLFGGHLEPGEDPATALVRELLEELGIEVRRYRYLGPYECFEGDAEPNIKHVFEVRIDEGADALTLYEGQRLEAIDPSERSAYRFANVLGELLEEFLPRCGPR